MYLHFRPWITKRTILHEYFSRSWGMFDAAERTENSSVAAMLTGQSIELAIKAMLELVGKEPPTTHKIAECLNTVPELKTLLEQLWGADLNSLIQFVDEDMNSSQMRYGAAGSHKDKETQLIAASIAHKPTSWTTPVTELYEGTDVQYRYCDLGELPRGGQEGTKRSAAGQNPPHIQR